MIPGLARTTGMLVSSLFTLNDMAAMALGSQE
jgi:hypothetical protein